MGEAGLAVLAGRCSPDAADPGWIEDGAGSGEARMAPGMVSVRPRPSRVLTTAVVAGVESGCWCCFCRSFCRCRCGAMPAMLV